LSSRTNLPFLAVLTILALATLCVAAVQLSGHIPISPWEPAIAIEAVRVNAGLPIYEAAHATHLYGPLLTILIAGIVQVFGLNLIAVRLIMSIFGIALAILLSAIFCPGKSRACLAMGIFLFLGLNLRTNLILFSIQPDWAATFIAVVALYIWITRTSSVFLSFLSLALFVCAMLFKQTTAAFAAIPLVYVLWWKRPLQFRDIALSLVPMVSILLSLAAVRVLWPQMFDAVVTIPASIRVYPGRVLNIALYLFLTFPIFLIALWFILRSRSPITERERWILSALVVLVPVSIWTTCKSGSGYNSLLFAYLALTALFVVRLDAIFDWLRALSIQRSFLAAIALALAILASFFLQFERAVGLLALRYGDDKYDIAVALARRLPGVVSTPQDPTIAYRANHYFSRSLFFELDAHNVNGNWPDQLPDSMVQELARAKYVVQVHSYVPTRVFDDYLKAGEFRPMSFPELEGSAYTVWARETE
jgi:hypothetical protein